ncbi:MAG TPA: hypothetical protein DCM87_20110 [Planctomycetes bacterium]|nr:hypothetical protein [Planctomycetota bacterium]
MTPERTPSTHELIVACTHGSEEAFQALIARLQPSLVHYAWGFSMDMARAEAVSLRTIEMVFGHLPRLRHNSLLSSYAIGILRKELRKEGLPSAPDNVPALWAALAGLPRVQREVVFLHFQGHALSEVAHMRREPPSHTRARLTRALMHVARRIGLAGPGSAGPLPPRCVRIDHVYLAVAGEAAPRECAAWKEHAAACPACGARFEKAEKLFAAVRADIGAFAARPPLALRMPGPPRAATWIGVAVILAAALAAFLALRGVFGPAAGPVIETPEGAIRAAGTP